jgi:hypothetical protein
MKVDGRLTKLEQRAKVTLRCDWCLYALHDVSPSTQKKYAADPNLRINASCPYCGTVYGINASSRDENEHEATIIYYKAKRGALYRDKRVFAAIYWLTHKVTLKRWRANYWALDKVTARNKAKEQRIQQQRYEKKKKDRYVREREELKERAFNFINKMRAKEEQEFAPHTFSLAAELESIEKPDRLGFISGTHKRMEYEEILARRVLYAVQVMASCERVLWGKVLSETEGAMIEISSIIQRCEEERAQKAREEAEEKAKQEAERERARLERLGITPEPVRPQSPPARPSPVWIDNGTIGGQQRRGQFRSGYPGWNDD